jgi:hypothetical protein
MTEARGQDSDEDRNRASCFFFLATGFHEAHGAMIRRIIPRRLRRTGGAILALLLTVTPLAVRAQSSPAANSLFPQTSTVSSRTSTRPGASPQTKRPAPVPYQPITNSGRLRWFVLNSIGPQSLAAGVFSSAIGTAMNSPSEYGPHWEGFGKRYGLRLTGIVTQNAMEAGIGAFWGEDPRYFRAQDEPLRRRIRNILVMTVTARGRDGDLHPAYARYMAIGGGNFLSNTWRPESQDTVGSALGRIGLGFAGHAAGNAFLEFWPDIKRIALRRHP